MNLKRNLISAILSAGMSLNLITLPASALQSEYGDVEESSWYADEVEYCTKKGLMSGSPDPQHFSPDQSTSRAMLVTMLYRSEGEPEAASSSFEDVLSDAWNFKAISWAAEQGIITGYNESHFGPSDALTREQMALIMMRYAAMKGENTGQRADLSFYQDRGEINPVMEQAMQWAISKGLLGQGISRLSPRSAISRAEVAAVLSRYFSRKEQEATQASNAIYDLEINENDEINVTYSANQKASLTIHILDADFNDYQNNRLNQIVTSKTIEIEPSQKGKIEISFDQTLPAHYIMEALIQKEDGSPLMEPYFYLKKCQAFETFLNTSYQDLLAHYETDRIVKLGESEKGENLALLDDEVKIFTPEQMRVEYSNGPDSAISGYLVSDSNLSADSLQEGDLLCLKNKEDNSIYLFELAHILERENGLLLTPGADFRLCDFYDFLKIDLDQNLINQNGDLSQIPSTTPSLSAAGSYESNLSLEGSFYYDQELFGENYFYSKILMKEKVNASFHLNQAGNLNTALELSPIQSYPTGIPGLEIQAGISLPVSGSLDGTSGGVLALDSELSLCKDTIRQNQCGISIVKDFLPEVEAAGDLLIGIDSRADLSFERFIEADLSNTLKFHLLAWPTDNTQFQEGYEHQCFNCLSGKTWVNENALIQEQAVVSSNTKLDENKRIESGEQEYLMPGTDSNAFYTSLASDENSSFEGLARRGFGTCKNLSYQTTIEMASPEGNPLNEQFIKILDNKDNFIMEGMAPLTLQLKTGTYKVITNARRFDQSLPFYVGSEPSIKQIKISNNFYPFVYHHEDEKLAGRIRGLIESYGMNPDNLCIIVENLQTGAYYGQNEYGDFFAASTYKLPLAMLYYEQMLRENMDAANPDPARSINSLSLPVIMDYLHRSIINSDNEAAMALFDNLGGRPQYTLIRQKYRSPSSSILLKYWDKESSEMRKDGPLGENALRYEDETCAFYVDGERLSLQLGFNYIEGDYLKNVLEYLYVYQERFPLLLEDLSKAQPTDFLNTKLPGYYYQKYGLYENFLNIAGINLKGSPYICIVLSQYEPHARSFMADMGVLCKDYFNPGT